ncbi:hypothetical protein N7G274_001127 [Stereocaulon virgatum]|uniref:Transposase n=1 Tax=Stereocaulon virgatum TaxID=373712 RepID=A0ABR4AUG4_9LECA
MAPELRRLYQRQTEPFARLVAILSILCFSQRQNTSTGFQTLLGLYFHSKGVKRRQLELLGQFGLSVSYHTILNIIKKQSEHAAAQVTASGQSDASVTAYDNFEQMEGVKEQRVDHQGAFHSVTTGQGAPRSRDTIWWPAAGHVGSAGDSQCHSDLQKSRESIRCYRTSIDNTIFCL